jgi:biotin carboxyl carrier protein
MKMEIPVETKFAGELVEWLVSEGSSVAAGQHIAILREKKHA